MNSMLKKNRRFEGTSRNNKTKGLKKVKKSVTFNQLSVVEHNRPIYNLFKNYHSKYDAIFTPARHVITCAELKRIN